MLLRPCFYLFLFYLLWVSVCEFAHVNAIPTEARRECWMPWSRVTGNCAAPKFRSSTRALCIFNHWAISPAPALAPALMLLEILTLLLTKYIASHPHSMPTILAVIRLKGSFMVWLLKAFGKEQSGAARPQQSQDTFENSFQREQFKGTNCFQI